MNRQNAGILCIGVCLLLIITSSGCLDGEWEIEKPPYYKTDVSDLMINENTTWTMNGSPYSAFTPVTVMPNVTLKIMPGVEFISQIKYISLDKQTYGPLVVKGRLLAEGTKESIISIKGTIDISRTSDNQETSVLCNLSVDGTNAKIGGTGPFVLRDSSFKNGYISIEGNSSEVYNNKLIMTFDWHKVDMGHPAIYVSGPGNIYNNSIDSYNNGMMITAKVSNSSINSNIINSCQFGLFFYIAENEHEYANISPTFTHNIISNCYGAMHIHDRITFLRRLTPDWSNFTFVNNTIIKNTLDLSYVSDYNEVVSDMIDIRNNYWGGGKPNIQIWDYNIHIFYEPYLTEPPI